MFPRRSISQITPSNTPREDFQEADNEMFTSLQPSRQKVYFPPELYYFLKHFYGLINRGPYKDRAVANYSPGASPSTSPTNEPATNTHILRYLLASAKVLIQFHTSTTTAISQKPNRSHASAAFFVTSSTESYPSAPANGSRCIEETSSVLYREAEESAGGCKSGEWDLE